ncbi:MAG: TlpA family protein disulfide reductase [Chloroflexi bacterium]|nr:TlpA family protein disulfide reductase [Chloroflexota bacterium]
MKKPGRVLALALVGTGLLILGVVTLFLLFGPGAVRGTQVEAPASVIPVAVDFPAPELELTDLNGNTVSLADYRGQVLLVNNWATWCPPCLAEMPELQAYYEAHRDEGFRIVAVEAGEPAGQVREFVEKYGLTFDVWPDRGQKALRTFGNLSLPNSYVIDRSGQVRYTWTGAISREMLEKYITSLLKE